MQKNKVMEANEIRVGNWLIDPRKFNKDTRDFFHINENGYFKATARDIQVAELFDSIPLTEEILLKCGFNYSQNIGEYETSDDDYCILIRKDEDTEEFYFEIGDLGFNYVFKTIKYLHQLQNLYFVLTGTELEINL